MTDPLRVLALAGSTRRESFNRRLVHVAAVAARDAGASVTEIDLADFRLPLFDADEESRSGKPEAARRLKQLLTEHHGLLIASPEYNGSVSGVLKNAIDWVSRPDPDDRGPRPAFGGKVVALMSASPGALGGLRGLVHVRAILAGLGCLVLPDQVAVPKAGAVLAEDGNLTDERRREQVEALGRGLVEIGTALRRGADE